MHPLASGVNLGFPYLRNSGNGFTDTAGTALVRIVQPHDLSSCAPVEQEAAHG